MKTALVVEDSLVERRAIASLLTRIGFEVVTVVSGEEAGERIDNSFQPDIIILDVILPGRSGFEVCRYLKTIPQISQVPIVFCSSKATELDKFWGLRQGAAAYLTKPLAFEELLQTVKQLIPMQFPILQTDSATTKSSRVANSH